MPGPAWQRLYGSGFWRRRSRLQLREHPLCKFCLDKGRAEPARCADHIEPHGGDPNKFYTGPLMSLCKSCHQSRKRFMEINGYAPDVSLSGWPSDPLHPSNKVKPLLEGSPPRVRRERVEVLLVLLGSVQRVELSRRDIARLTGQPWPLAGWI